MCLKGLVFAILAFGLPTGAYAQPEYNDTGWRPATGEEKSLRSAFDGAKNSWRKEDGEELMYSCMLAWAFIADTGRKSNDSFPTISGDLSHAFAEGQLSHYLNTLYVMAGRDAQVFSARLNQAGASIDKVVPLDNQKKMLAFLGKCYVHPSSWSFSEGVTMTGPQFLREFAGLDSPDAYPPHVKDETRRAEFDRLVLSKDFATAANYGALLHGTGFKSTVYWHEVLNASLLATESGNGLKLDDGLLKVLSDVWWPKYRRGWAKNMLRAKRGLPDPNRPPLHDPGKEPAWAKQERDRYLRGETNYTPCNIWNRQGC